MKKFPFKKIFILLLSLLVVGAIVVSAYVGYIYVRWNGQKEDILSRLEGYKRQLDFQRKPVSGEKSSSYVDTGIVAVPSRIYGRNNELIGEFYVERRNLVTLKKMSGYFPLALVASEDRRFYKHHGVDYQGILRAIIINIMQFRYAQGGSTITQQLAKVLFTNREKSIKRKIFEVFCAKEIESHYTKKQILEMYLNLIFTGHGNYGVDASTRYLFNKSAGQVDLAEVAMIIGMLPSPGNFSPVKDLEKSLDRQKKVLAIMVSMGDIDTETANKQLKKFFAKWQVVKTADGYRSKIGKFKGKEYRINLAPFFLDSIYQKLEKHFTPEVITRGGLSIYTTLDYKRQLAAKRAVMNAIDKQREHYKQLAEKLKKSGKAQQAQKFLNAQAKTQGAFISIDPRDGSVLAMVGGYKYSGENQFNRALLAKRQTGSILKPLIYYMAIKRKAITPATLVEDTKFVVGKTNFRNYDFSYLGNISARDALRKSRNTTAVRILQQVGIDEFRRLLADLLDMRFSDLSKTVPRELGIALGTSSFTPQQVARLYMPMVNEGKSVPLKDLLLIEDKMGRVLWEKDSDDEEREVLDPIASYITLSMLEGVFEPGGTASWVGRLQEKTGYLDYEIAGKTGTTSDYRDAWFLGMTSDEVAVTWIGNDDNTTLGKGRSGGRVCSPIWVDYIRSSRQDNPPAPFYANFPFEGTTTESFCSKSGGVPRPQNPCEDVVEDQLFYAGTEPRFFDTPAETEKTSEDIFQ